MAVCQKNKLIDNNDYKYIKSTEDHSSIFVLTWDEIMTMYNLDIEDKLLSKVRDVFCFQCFTGQRYGDIQSLKWRDIKEEKGKMYWYLYQLKTKNTKPIRIPIMPMAKEILMKYQTNNKELHHNVFSAPHNAVQNKKLKELGLKSKLKGEFTTIMKQGFRRIEEVKKRYEKLSTHCARKSFISISIEKGMSISAIQKISGHTTIRAMKPYIELSQQFVEDELLDAWSNS